MNTQNHAEIKHFINSMANDIQKVATQQHKQFIGGGLFRTEIIERYQEHHIQLVKGLARFLEPASLEQGLRFFKQQAETFAQEAVRDELTLQETIDGVIFLKQAVWQKVFEAGLLSAITAEDYYQLSQLIGTYIDVVSSKIAFTYHQNYMAKEEKIMAELRRVSKNKDEFIGAATHELRTPVTTLKGYTQVLERRLLKTGDEKSAEHLRKMDAQLNRLNNLISDLLDATKIESGKLQFQLGKFDFDKTVRETVEAMQQTTDRHHIHINGQTNTKIYGDNTRIVQVVSNLLSNAIKYSPNANEIIVTIQEKNDQVLFSVQDFGVGIPRDKLREIFKRFYRVSGAKEDTFPGLGLGLYISSEIIKRHGGEIWAESKAGKGSTFFFVLPIKKRKIVQEKNTLVEEEIKRG